MDRVQLVHHCQRKSPNDESADVGRRHCRRVRDAGVQGDDRDALGSSDDAVRLPEPVRRTRGAVQGAAAQADGGGIRVGELDSKVTPL